MMASSNVLNSEFLVWIFWHIWDGNQTLQNWGGGQRCHRVQFQWWCCHQLYLCIYDQV